MLAKNVKLRLIKKQYDFIQSQLDTLATAILIDSSETITFYRYCGHIFPEVWEKLQENNSHLTFIIDDAGDTPLYAFINSNAQRLEIEKYLSDTTHNTDGDPMFTYPFYITDDNLKYFEEQGYRIKVRQLSKNVIPDYIFSIDEDRVKLSPEELLIAEKYPYFKDE